MFDLAISLRSSVHSKYHLLFHFPLALLHTVSPSLPSSLSSVLTFRGGAASSLLTSSPRLCCPPLRNKMSHFRIGPGQISHPPSLVVVQNIISELLQGFSGKDFTTTIESKSESRPPNELTFEGLCEPDVLIKLTWQVFLQDKRPEMASHWRSESCRSVKMISSTNIWPECWLGSFPHTL